MTEEQALQAAGYTEDRCVERLRLLIVLRAIHHQRYMSLRFEQRPWMFGGKLRMPQLRDDVGNVYDKVPIPLDWRGEWPRR